MGSFDAIPNRSADVTDDESPFESMPHGEARFLETPRVRTAIRRPLVSGPQAGEVVLTELVAAATAADEPREGE